MDFQLWVRELVSNAARLNTIPKLAQLGPEMLRRLYDEGMEPTAQALVEHLRGQEKTV